MQNELWNPFPSGAGQFFFLDTLEGGIEEKTKHEDIKRWNEAFPEESFTYKNMTILDFTFALKLGSNIKIITRTRYNVWDLLGDVGGFNDGLHLVGYFLISTYASFSFKQSIL